MYEFFKDFAGPIATIVAASAAFFVTVYFNQRQAGIAAAQKDIAAAQRDIAVDKLKHDLFDRRYDIYSAAKRLIEHYIFSCKEAHRALDRMPERSKQTRSERIPRAQGKNWRVRFLFSS
jgi:hypothetical protein